MRPLDNEITSVIDQWKLVIQDADRALSDLSDDELQLQISPGRNRLYYVFGHLTAVHDRALPLFREMERLHPELDILFLDSPDGATDDLEMTDSLRRAWVEVNGALSSAIEAHTSEEWLERRQETSRAGFMVIPRHNRLATLLSLTSHLSYHLGQIRLVRREH